MAVVAAAHGRPVRAARLWGAAAARRYALVVPSVVVRPLEEHLLVPARDRLDSETFDAEWSKGLASTVVVYGRAEQAWGPQR